MQILLVEDNDDHADLIQEILSDQSTELTVNRCSTGEEAISALRKEGIHAETPNPDLIFLDFKLPGISGLDVLRIIKSTPEFRRIPVVVLSTSNAIHDRQAAYENGANSYTVKPMDFKQFHYLIETVIDYWQSINFSFNPDTDN